MSTALRKIFVARGVFAALQKFCVFVLFWLIDTKTLLANSLKTICNGKSKKRKKYVQNAFAITTEFVSHCCFVWNTKYQRSEKVK